VNPDPDPRLSLALARLARSVGLPAGFAGLSATEKLNAILDASDPARLVRALRADEFYGLVRQIGLEDAAELLALASPEQRRAVRDLEVWSGEEYEPARLDVLLDLAMQDGLERALELIRDCDLELLALHVFKQARVMLASEAEDEDLPDEGSFLSPDGVFMVLCEDPSRVPSVRRFLDLLYAEGVEFAHKILFGGRFETRGSLEAQALHFRDKRLEDLGFPPPEERFAIWEPFDLDGLRAQIRRPPAAEAVEVEPKVFPLALVLAGRERPSFLYDALAAAAADPAFPVFAHRMLYLVNRVLATRTRTYHEDARWDEAAAEALALVSLGLEALSDGSQERAPEVLLAVHPQYLYRAGVETLRPLNLLARKVVREVSGAVRLPVLGEARAEVVRAALKFPPQRALFESGSECSWTLAEVQRTREALRGMLEVLSFARAVCGFAPSASSKLGSLVEPTIANVLATAWARKVLNGEVSLAPLAGEEVQDLRVAAFDSGRIRRALREAFLETAPDREAVRAYLNDALDRVEDALSALDPGREVDVRFIGDCLLVRKT